MKKNIFLKKSFTLLEMLVVIGIIGILVSVGFASYSTAQKKSRDSKRKNDLKSIQNAFEQYYSICNYKYPATIPSAGNKLIATSANCLSLSSNVELITMPSDPLGGSYQCVGTCDSTGYTICPKDLGGG
ncbi:MAG: type II secretion system GspH family protein, partial [Patescibacteria group bacterium]|nr:type II secretion system GspH family protein [Patescibacteria group bacterium]